MNFTRKVRTFDGDMNHAVIKMTAVQAYDHTPTTVFTEIVGDDRLLLRNRVLYCDFRASDALLRDLVIVLQVFDRALPTPKTIDLIVGNVTAFTYLSRQAPPATNTTYTLCKQVSSTIKSLSSSVRVSLLPQDKAFVEYRKFVTEQYDASDRMHPTFVETGIGKVEYTYDDIRQVTGQ